LCVRGGCLGGMTWVFKCGRVWGFGRWGLGG